MTSVGHGTGSFPVVQINLRVSFPYVASPSPSPLTENLCPLTSPSNSTRIGTTPVKSSSPLDAASFAEASLDQDLECREEASRATAWLMVRTPSFALAFSRWKVTVRFDTLRIWLISQADFPSAAHFKHSNSRGVRITPSTTQSSASLRRANI